MDTMFFERLGDVNYFAAIVATIAAMAVGFVWYSKALFGKIWMKEVGMTEESCKKNCGKAMIGGLVFTFISAVILATFVMGTDWIFGVKMGAILGAGIAATTAAGGSLWEQRSWNLILINAVQITLSFMAMGAVLGAWQ